MLLDRWPALHRVHSREEPFIAVNPFQSDLSAGPFSRCFRSKPEPDPEAISAAGNDIELACDDVYLCFPSAPLGSSRHFLLDSLPRQMYLHLLLRLPSLYFSRVARIFEDAEVSRPEIQRMIAAATEGPGSSESDTEQRTARTGPPRLPFPDEWNPPMVSPALVRFKHSWEAFIDSLLREWKTLNVVSALLLS